MSDAASKFPSHPYLQALTDRVLVYDGAMGTNIQLHQPTAEDFGTSFHCTS